MKLAAPQKKTKELLMTIDDFTGGTNSLVEEAKMGTKFAKESVNMMQVQDGLWKTRWGTVQYGAEHATTIDGAAEYVKSDGTTELVTVTNGKAYKSIQSIYIDWFYSIK